MKVQFPIAIVALGALSACSSSTGFFGTDEELFIGTRSAGGSANGLPFAVSSSVVEDLETDGSLDIKVVRALTDWDTGATRLLITNETLTLASGDIANSLQNVTITLGGETLVFSGGSSPASNGQTDWTSYLNTVGTVSGTGSVYSYEMASDPALTGEFDTEAFFAFGYETNPNEIALLVGNAIYNGTFDGYGQALDPTSGAVVGSERDISGTISLTASFDANTVDGTLDGSINHAGSWAFTTAFAAPINGNGYIANLDSLNCTGATCVSNSQLAGAFYGANASETSGIMALDIQVAPTGGGGFRFLGGGGFTAIK